MPDPGGGGGAGGGGGGRGGNQGGGRRRPFTRERQGNEEIKKFLNFYKRKNSLCVDLYLPAFYQRKPSYDDLADFVFSVMSVGGALPPNVIRAAVLDIQLHPVKKLLFIKFTDQPSRDDVVGRLQAGLHWPAYDTTVSGWSMDKPMERVRVLGSSPETDQAEIRMILGQYGEVVDAQKGFISKKLPGCTNGIWTVKMFMEEGKSLPPFLIMKDDGEVWQLATGDASVCWKCGQGGHIGDKCRQDVNILAESLASPAVGVQPSWAHVVKGGVSLVIAPPPPPPRHQPQQLTFFKISGGILRAGKASLKTCQEPRLKFSDPVGKIVLATEAAALEGVEESSMDVQHSFAGEDKANKPLLDNATSLPLKKKTKLSSEAGYPRDPCLRAREVSGPSSPDLHHKVSAGRVQQHGPVIEDEQRRDSSKGEELRHGLFEGEHVAISGVLVSSEVGDVNGGDSNEGGEDCRDVQYVVWFDVIIEGEEKCEGRLEFGFKEKKDFSHGNDDFWESINDFFHLFEDICSSQSHKCHGRVMGVLMEIRDRAKDDSKCTVDLIEKYRDAHIVDGGWREADPGEWKICSP